jgi:hypothetical protein
MEDLIGKAHAYLDDKGCKSMGQQYTAFEIERMLADFAQQEIERIVLEQKNESFSGHELDGKTIPVTFHVYKYKPKIVIDFE